MSDCARCDELGQAIEHIRAQLVDAGRAAEPVRSFDDNDQERELARYLSNAHEPDAASGYRAGWHALGRLSRPRLHEWEQLWWRAVREGDRLKASVGRLLMEQSRLSDGG